MRTIVHIGMHKAGSTSIQTALYKNHDLLKEQGIFYPLEDTIWSGHHFLAWALGVPHPRHRKEFDWESSLSTYIENAGDRTLVLSSEDFELVPCDQVKVFLQRISSFGTVDVICYFRHPADWIVSAFKWHALKEAGRFHNVGHYMDNANIEKWLDYGSKADKWSQYKVKFTPRVYNKDVVGDFLSIVGATGIDTKHADNISPLGITAKIVAEIGRNHHVSQEFVREFDKNIR